MSNFWTRRSSIATARLPRRPSGAHEDALVEQAGKGTQCRPEQETRHHHGSNEAVSDRFGRSARIFGGLWRAISMRQDDKRDAGQHQDRLAAEEQEGQTATR